MSKIKFNVNSKIKELLHSKHIHIEDGVGYLLCLYYNLNPSYIPEILIRKVSSTGIFTKKYASNIIVWKTPLFEEQETGYEWIKDWMDMFKKVNPERRGVKRDVLTRMKRFFVDNPSLRKEDVMKATKFYLDSVDNSKYCKKSHKFIYEADGSSMLLDYAQQVEEIEKRDNTYKGDII